MCSLCQCAVFVRLSSLSACSRYHCSLCHSLFFRCLFFVIICFLVSFCSLPLSILSLEFRKSQRAVENRENWRKLVEKSSVVPQRPSCLRDWCCWWHSLSVPSLSSSILCYCEVFVFVYSLSVFLLCHRLFSVSVEVFVFVYSLSVSLLCHRLFFVSVKSLSLSILCQCLFFVIVYSLSAWSLCLTNWSTNNFIYLAVLVSDTRISRWWRHIVMYSSLW